MSRTNNRISEKAMCSQACRGYLESMFGKTE
jgi:hypothetical protein